MAKVHDKYVVELAEIIKGYGNDPDINDPFCLSEFYRFYEVPNVCVSAENFKKMRPLSDYTEEIEPESISEWKKEFREYVDSLDITRDDWKGVIEYINEMPSAQPEPRTAYWTKDIVGSVVCSNCGGIREDNRIGHTQWCNCCGCFMRGEQKCLTESCGNSDLSAKGNW